MQTLIDFKNNYPILFWIFLPLVAVAAIFLFLTGSKKPEEIVRPVEKQDADLKVEIQEIKDQATEQQHDAQEIQQKIDNINENTVKDNWYEKKE
jgi:Sec-independent protein translocase protein TatA